LAVRSTEGLERILGEFSSATRLAMLRMNLFTHRDLNAWNRRAVRRATRSERRLSWTAVVTNTECDKEFARVDRLLKAVQRTALRLATGLRRRLNAPQGSNGGSDLQAGDIDDIPATERASLQRTAGDVIAVAGADR
jgi:hypothetical protein